MNSGLAIAFASAPAVFVCLRATGPAERVAILMSVVSLVMIGASGVARNGALLLSGVGILGIAFAGLSVLGEAPAVAALPFGILLFLSAESAFNAIDSKATAGAGLLDLGRRRSAYLVVVCCLTAVPGVLILSQAGRHLGAAWAVLGVVAAVMASATILVLSIRQAPGGSGANVPRSTKPPDVDSR